MSRTILLCCLLPVLACQHEPPPPPPMLTLAARMIEQEPATRAVAGELLDEVPVVAYHFVSHREVAAWQGLAGHAYELDGDGLTVSTSGRPVSLHRRVDWQAAEIDAIRIELSGPWQGQLRLSWAGPNARFAEQRCFTYQHRQPAEAGADGGAGIVLAVHEHPAWQGRITQLRLDPSVAPALPFCLRRVVAVRYRAGPRLRAAGQRPFRIELDNELRNGFLALPGAPVLWSLTVPPAASLRVGWGAAPGIAAVVSLRVVLETGGKRTTLLETTVGPGQGGGGGQWHDTLLELDQAATGPVTVSLETEAAWEQLRSLVFWSEPLLLQPAAAAALPPSLVLISIDALRADHLSLYGYQRPTCPTLEAWAAASAVVFEQAVATAPWTLPSHLSMLSGLDALQHGVNHKGRIPDHVPLLAPRLRAAGYTTLAVTGGGFLHPEYGFARGFDRYRYWPQHTAEEELRQGLARCLDWLAEHRRQPFFLFFHTYEVHYPYRARQPYLERLGGVTDQEMAQSLGYVDEPQNADNGFLLSKRPVAGAAGRTRPFTAADRQHLVDCYDSGIAYTDNHLGKLLEQLAASGLDRRAVVLLTADHGEALGEKGLAGHAYLDDWNLMVPLLLGLPDRRGAGTRVATQVSLTGIAPTLLELAGLRADEEIASFSRLPSAPHLRLALNREILDVAFATPAVSLNRSSQICSTAGGELCEAIPTSTLSGPGNGSDRSLLRLLGSGATPPARPAWSYAGFANRGVSLRLGRGWKYLLNDSGWPQLLGQERLYDLRSDPGEQHDLAATSRLTPVLREQVTAALRAATGLRLELAGDQALGMSCSVSGPAIHPTRVKAICLPTGALRWSGQEQLDLLVAPGTRLQLLLTGVPRSDLRLTVALGAGPATQLELDLGTVTDGWQLRYNGEAWQEEMADAAVPVDQGPVLRLLPQGPGPWRQGADPAHRDSALRRQLEALGYLAARPANHDELPPATEEADP